MEHFIINFAFTYTLDIQGNYEGCPESIERAILNILRTLHLALM